MINNSIEKELDKILVDFSKVDSPGCILSIIKEGHILHKKAYGIANLEHNVPINEDTVFNIGSISKQFTATCIALLEEEDRLSLKDSITDYIPELPRYCSKITLGDLIYMTNGIRDFYNVTQYIMGVVEDDFVNEEEVFKILKGIKDPIFEPGEKWMYGNSGYFLLSIIIKRITDKSLGEFAKENIFDILGMKNTFFRNDRSKIIKNRAQGYCKYGYLHRGDQQQESQKSTLCLNTDNCELTGAGQVWTTIGDMYLWDQNFYNNKLGKGDQKLITKITKSGKLNNGEECGYGYGLFLGERNGRKHQFHGGSTAGFLTTYYRLPEENLSIIWFSNSNYGYYELAERLGVGIDKYIADLVLGQGGTDRGEDALVKDEPIDLITADDNLEKFIGSYQCAETASVWEITCEGGALIVKQNRERQFHLKAVDNNKFEDNNNAISCEYKNNQENKFEIYVTMDNKQYLFSPFQLQLTVEDLEEYTGEYYCDQIDTTFILSIDNNLLFISNKDRHRNGIDFHYTYTIKDHFINFNDYAGSLMTTFKRDKQGIIKSFVFRDYDGDKRENLAFEKMI